MSQDMDAVSSTSGEVLPPKRSITTEENEHRPPHKTIKFDELDDIFKHTTISEFCISGEIEFNEKLSKIFYKSSNGNNRCLDVLKISEKDIDTLINDCSVSPFGMGTRSMVDLTVREAKELGASDFACQFNPNILSTMTLRIKKLLSGRDFFIEPYKLNIYPKGGHFKKHKDTLKNDKMIASLVMCLPIPFEGGVLIVENEKGQYVDFDWGKENADSGGKQIRWACFFCSCDHTISKVKEEQGDADEKSNIIPEKYRDECKKYLEKFIKELVINEMYGYFRSHVYSFSDTGVYAESEEKGMNLRNNLKGNDLLLYDILNQYGWRVIMQVYYPDLASYGPVVPFNTDGDGDHCYREDTVDESDRRKLSALSAVKLLNLENDCKRQAIHEYYVGYTGNLPISKFQIFYAGTIMILKHQNSSAMDVPSAASQSQDEK